MPKSSRRRYCLVALESTYGTAVTRAKSNAIRARSLEIEPLAGDTLERQQIRPYIYTPAQSIPDKTCVVTLELELSGSGKSATTGTAVVPPRWHPLLQACGYSQAAGAANAGKFQAIQNRDNHKSCSIWANVDGMEQVVTGCRGTFVINGELGNYPTITFTMTGSYSNPTDVSGTANVPSDSDADTDIAKAERFGSETAQVKMLNLAVADIERQLITTLSVDCGNVIELRGYVNSSAPKAEVVILDRQPTGSVTFQANTVANLPVVKHVNEEATHSFEYRQESDYVTVTSPTVKNNGIIVKSPKCAYDSPTYGDDSGDLLMTLPLRFQATGEAIAQQALELEFKDFAKFA